MAHLFFKILKSTILYIAFPLFVFLLVSCNQTKEDDLNQEEVNYTLEGNYVILSENSNISSWLKLYTVAEEKYQHKMTTAGTVKAIPNYYAEIAPPFAGRVLKSHVRLGQKVQPGSAIFEISSPDYFSAQKEYFDAKQEFRQAELNLKRQRDLLENGVGVQRDIEEAETKFETQKTTLSNAGAALRIFSVDPDKIVLGHPLVVRSPIRGEVVQNNIVIGQYLREDVEPIAIVAELSKVWIVGQVKEKDIHFINKMEEVGIKIGASPDDIIKGKIYHVNEIVNEDTRSVEVLIECENKDRNLKPGMYVTVLFTEGANQLVTVPANAVFQKENQQFVFVQVENNKFEKRQIKTVETADKWVIIQSGLSAGEIIVSEGGSLLLGN